MRRAATIARGDRRRRAAAPERASRLPHRAMGLLLLLMLACVGNQLAPEAPVRIASDALGLSGLTVDDRGDLWAIPEERRELLRIDEDDGEVQSFPIYGIPDHLETEAIAFLSPGRFVIGTEGNEANRPSDDILVLSFDGREARLEQMMRCPYGLWRLEAQHNRGIEGLCTFEQDILVAAEITGEVDGRRYAPLGRRTSDGRWTAYRVWLSSRKGKLAGIICERHDDGTEHVLAIERHFGVMRLLDIPLPRVAPVAKTATSIEPVVLRNLDAWMRRQSPSPNFEGLARVDDDRLALLVDNQFHGQRTGPSELWFLQLDADDSHDADGNDGM